jgi:hypothetical protein
MKRVTGLSLLLMLFLSDSVWSKNPGQETEVLGRIGGRGVSSLEEEQAIEEYNFEDVEVDENHKNDRGPSQDYNSIKAKKPKIEDALSYPIHRVEDSPAVDADEVEYQNVED